MVRVSKHPLCSLLGILLGLAACSGTLTAATWTYKSTSALHIWDISGQHGQEPAFTLNEDVKGKLSGGGEMLNFTVTVEEGGVEQEVSVSATYTVTGHITQTAGVGKVSLTLKAKGTATMGAETSKFTGTEILRATINPATSVLTGTLKRSMTAFGEHGSETIDVSETLTDGMDGSFTLTVDASTGGKNGKKATGSATLTLSNGDVYQFTGKGSYSAKRQAYQYLLTLRSPEKLDLKLYVNETTGVITKLTGKALGQNLRATNLTPEPAAPPAP